MSAARYKKLDRGCSPGTPFRDDPGLVPDLIGELVRQAAADAALGPAALRPTLGSSNDYTLTYKTVALAPPITPSRGPGPPFPVVYIECTHDVYKVCHIVHITTICRYKTRIVPRKIKIAEHSEYYYNNGV